MQDTVYISGLEPLVAPERVAWWPPAIGWFVIVGMLLLALVLLLLWWIRRRRAMRYRVVALNRLKEIEESAGRQAIQGDIQALNRLLKETALTIFPREQVASLFGKEWREFLDKHCTKTRFSDPHGELLNLTAYTKSVKENIPAGQWIKLIAEVETWIRKHKY